MSDTVRFLVALPATDVNFVSALARATNDELGQAIEAMMLSGGKNKARISACGRELRRRKGLEEECTVKTDCFAYRPKGLTGNGTTPNCDALTQLYCREGKCGFYKPKAK